MKVNIGTRLGLAVAATLACAATAWAAGTTNETVYTAQLKPMNTNVTGVQTSGTAKLTVQGDTLTILIKVRNAPPNMVHWQHFHGFKNGDPAACATEKADANGDGIVDLIETEPKSGTTMVPFDNDPAAMDVAHGTYPTAAGDGSYSYKETVSLKALDAAFAKAFKSDNLELGNRVIYIHGVPSDTRLPDSVASLGPIPAQVTLPIACGKIERADAGK